MINRLLHYGYALAIGMAFLAVRAFAAIDTPQHLLAPDAIMQKAVERAESPASRELRPNYFYNKHTVTEDLDLKGHVKDRKEKLYEVKVESGMSYLKLLQLNGQSLSSVELKKQEEKEVAERQKMTDTKPGNKGDERENFLTAELVQKYDFRFADYTTFKGRTTYVLTFEPKSDLPSKKLTDRFLNQMAGTVWIDAEDFEIARAEIHLKAEVTLWGGLVGTLRHCRFTMERTRMPDGVWFNSLSHGIFEGRKLLEPMLIRTRSESSNFHHPGLALR
jgi:hypothetical protein